MIIFGLTGGIGTGKTTAAAAFERLGAVRLDADALTHDLIQPRKPAWRQIVAFFGRGILNDDQTINRECLASIVFSQPGKLESLERIIHPKVLWQIRKILNGLRKQKRCRAAVVEIPLLFEVGAQKLVDYTVVVSIPKKVQQERLKKKYGWSARTINQRISAQWALSAKEDLADFVIDNSRSVRQTQQQVKAIWDKVVLKKKR